jgi:hypothetical protein
MRQTTLIQKDEIEVNYESPDDVSSTMQKGRSPKQIENHGAGKDLEVSNHLKQYL